MKIFFKGIIVGLGAIAPGLSGSILLVIFGLYQKIVSTVSNIFKNFKKNVLFLLPLVLGIGLGIIIFSKLIVIPLNAFKMQTYYAFLGLILGTIPMLFKEVRKEGFAPKYYIFMAGAFVFGVAFFILNMGAFPEVVEPKLWQSFVLGLAVAGAYLIPGVDSFAILSSFGLYDLWINSINEFNFKILLPAGLGVAVGGIAISLIFNKLFSKWYTGTYSVIFGLFISVILNFVFKECPTPSADGATAVSFILLVLGFAFSFAFSHIEDIMEKLKKADKTEK